MKINGNRLLDFLDKNAVKGSTVKFAFCGFYKKAFFIKLEKINGKKLYSFSRDWHKKIHNLKVPLEYNKEYYIYEDDLDEFNKLEAYDQLQYLNKMMFDGMCLGDIDSDTIQAYLLNLVQPNVQYEFNVLTSTETDTEWLTTALDEKISITIWLRPIRNNIDRVWIEIDENAYNLNINKTPTTYKVLTEFFESFNESKLLRSKSVEENQQLKGYYKRIDVWGFPIHNGHDDKKFVHIFSVVISTGLNKYNNYVQQFRYIIAPKLNDEIGKVPNFSTEYITSIKRTKEVLHKICDFLRENENFDRVADEIEEKLDTLN